MTKAILYIEDSQKNIRLLERTLDDFDLKIISSNSAKEGVQLLRNDQDGFDLVMLDVLLKDSDANSFEAKLVDPIRKLTNVPIFVLTAHGSSRQLALLKKSNIDHLIQKPMNPEEVRKLIKTTLFR